MRFSHSQPLCVLRRVVLILDIKCRINIVIFENPQRRGLDKPGPYVWAIQSVPMPPENGTIPGEFPHYFDALLID
jgi:hypothetical protein